MEGGGMCECECEGEGEGEGWKMGKWQRVKCRANKMGCGE